MFFCYHFAQFTISHSSVFCDLLFPFSHLQEDAFGIEEAYRVVASLPWVQHFEGNFMLQCIQALYTIDRHESCALEKTEINKMRECQRGSHHNAKDLSGTLKLIQNQRVFASDCQARGSTRFNISTVDFWHSPAEGLSRRRCLQGFAPWEGWIHGGRAHGAASQQGWGSCFCRFPLVQLLMDLLFQDSIGHFYLWSFCWIHKSVWKTTWLEFKPLWKSWALELRVQLQRRSKRSRAL